MAKIDFKKLALEAAQIAEEKKAIDTIILDVRKQTAIANHFVITTAESAPQINAICNEIEKTFKDKGIRTLRREGIASPSWRVIDYGGLVIHVMDPYVRDTYKLENLWNDAKQVKTKPEGFLKIKEPNKVQKNTKKVKKNYEQRKEGNKKKSRKKSIKS